MIKSKQDFFMIKECAASIGFELASKSFPAMKAEVENLMAHSEANEEAETLTVTF